MYINEDCSIQFTFPSRSHSLENLQLLSINEFKNAKPCKVNAYIHKTYTKEFHSNISFRREWVYYIGSILPTDKEKKAKKTPK